jgi:hypothetical protein
MSSTSALVCSEFCHAKLGRQIAYRSFRYLATYLFELIYFALTVTLLVYLTQWDTSADSVGYCYNTRGIAASGASHPATDIAYVIVLSASLLAVMTSAAFMNAARRKLILFATFIQYPVRTYRPTSRTPVACVGPNPYPYPCFCPAFTSALAVILLTWG